MDLKDKVIIVTGGTGVLGQSFVEGIHHAGGIVGILGRNKAIAEERAALINNVGGKAIALVADVMSEADLIAAKDKVISEFGRIDGLVNGAGGNMPGGVVPPEADVFKLNMDGLRQVMELNLWGTLIPTQVFGEEMAKAGRGSIVNISSMASQRVITKVLGYTLAKTAIDAYTKWFAVEMANRYGDKLRMNAIAPGFIETDMTHYLKDGDTKQWFDKIPLARFGKPEEVANVALFLASDMSSYVSGQVINTCGGMTT